MAQLSVPFDTKTTLSFVVEPILFLKSVLNQVHGGARCLTSWGRSFAAAALVTIFHTVFPIVVSVVLLPQHVAID